ncbi:MAG: outer membrane beta-barrel protein [Terracidiphilus sp.]
MRLMNPLPLAAVFLSACAAISAFAQAPPAARGSTAFSPLAVGVGFNSFNAGWNDGYMMGAALWIDYTPDYLPSPLKGLGLEVEARDISINSKANQREDIASGGVIYSVSRFNKIHPYGKFLMGIGSEDYGLFSDTHLHKDLTVTSVGGGADYRLFRQVWARGDFEYQFWPDFFKYAPARHKSPGTLSPYGFTIGAMYHF